MQFIIQVVENLAVMALTIAVLAAGCYLLLVFMNWWLRLKTGSREQEGLARLWQSAQPAPRSDDPEETEDKED